MSSANGTAIHFAAVRRLFAQGVCQSVKPTDTEEWTRLHHGCVDIKEEMPMIKVSALLLDYGANVDSRDVLERTPLMNAPTVGCARFLLSRGARFDLRDTFGNDAEANALQYGYSHVARFLADARRAGTFERYVRAPRVCLNLLRVLCERGRASAPRPERRALDLGRVFGPQSGLPKEVFWLVLEFWRCERVYRNDRHLVNSIIV